MAYRPLLAAASIVLLAAGPALAELCAKCRDMAFTADIGKCRQCGGETASGAFELCPACSTKLGKCQACQAPLSAGPADRPAATSQPASQPAAERVKMLKAHLAELTFEFRYVGEQGKPFYRVTLSVPDFMLDEPAPFVLAERITPEQGGKIVDLLAAGGWLARAAEVDTLAKPGPAPADGYVLRVEGFARFRALDGGLGFDLKMLRQFDAIRAALDGQAARAMDLLLGRMSGLRRQWESAEASAGAPPRPVVIQVGKASLAVDAQSVADMAELERHLAKLPAASAVVVIRADKSVPWARIVEILNVARKLKLLDVRFAVPAAPEDGP